MSREEAFEQAAVLYRRAGYDLDAARCYRLAGAHRRAAEIYEAAGHYAQAADSFADAGLPELGAWLLAHQAGQPAQARALLLSAPVRGTGPGQASRVWARSRHPFGGGPGRLINQALPDPVEPGLRYRLVLARCEIAEGAAPDVIRPVIDDVCAALANPDVRSDQVTEEWAVVLSEAAERYDQAALVFAASVRGGRYGAEQRWKAWARRVLDAEIIVPVIAPVIAAPTARRGPTLTPSGPSAPANGPVPEWQPPGAAPPLHPLGTTEPTTEA